MNRLPALILLFALGCVLMAGPHPCHPRSTMPDTSRTTAGATMTCHAQGPANRRSAGPAISAAGGEDCCARHGVLCEAACQTVGVVRVAIPQFTIQPLAIMAAPAIDRCLPLFAHPIDHIPLT